MNTNLVGIEKMIASLRKEREGLIGSKARKIDKQIAGLVKAWKNSGGKLKVVED